MAAAAADARDKLDQIEKSLMKFSVSELQQLIAREIQKKGPPEPDVFYEYKNAEQKDKDLIFMLMTYYDVDGASMELAEQAIAAKNKGSTGAGRRRKSRARKSKKMRRRRRTLKK
jgi:hypothetical protein